VRTASSKRSAPSARTDQEPTNGDRLALAGQMKDSVDRAVGQVGGDVGAARGLARPDPEQELLRVDRPARLLRAVAGVELVLRLGGAGEQREAEHGGDQGCLSTQTAPRAAGIV
jgi:hypothetical protein